jgi:hypothetical protein
MLTRTLSTGALVIAAIGGAFGCECSGVQPFCNALPASSDGSTPVFVGIAKDIYPAETRADYRRILGRAAALDDLKRGLLSRWRGYLSESEEDRIRTASSVRDLAFPFESGMPWSMPRLVTLEVVEPLRNSNMGDFKVFTGIGEGDCGVGFHKGEKFLVVAHIYGPAGRWSTDVCSRTQAIEDAAADLKALRASKNL